MSYTKGEIVNAALEEIGIASYEFDLAPEQISSAILRLDSMVADWNGRGLSLSFPITKEANSAVDQDTNIPDWSWEAVITNLAIRLAPSYGKAVSVETKVAAKNSFNTVCARLSIPKEMQFNSMPRGAGYKSTTSRFLDDPVNQYLEPVEEDFDPSGGPE